MKKIFVVSTLGYQRLESVLKNLEKILRAKDPKEEWEFYIVNENYGSSMPDNIKFKNYIFTSDSTNDEEMNKIYNGVNNWPEFDYSLQTDEYAVTILALINEKLKLSGLTLDDEHKFRDKVTMKQKLGNDINKPILYTLEDVKNNTVEYPVIIKPRTFAASKGVKLITDKKSLLNEMNDKHVDYSRASIDTMDDYEIEQYINGDVYHIDGIVFEEKIIFCVASQYIGSCFEYAQGKLLGSIKATDIQQRQAQSFAEKIHRDLVIPNGVFHLEAFYYNGEFVFLEIGMRPGGAEIVPAIKAATGVDLANEHIKCQLGIKPKFGKNTEAIFGWLNFPREFEFEKDKYIKKIILPQYTPQYLYSSSIPKIGDRATEDFVHYDSSLGSFIFVGKDRDAIKDEMKVYAEQYKVIVG
ncbi:MAG TPA: ATP-grasp domain-containing protein [Candidatus Fimimorpha faecalis]|uniref:ATP-grasp domain-containing protein n=1 Tax=Candidatus Fimimorpha faecalis TaxID=2840824 RepID=A0A9D1EC20_9FIRM|nr:ATP-grasp domain-containing protein [Candidatus Fimimorpha faecalis]